jgi:hypothetical protein
MYVLIDYVVGTSAVVIITACCLDVFFVSGFEISGHKIYHCALVGTQMFLQRVSVNVWLHLCKLIDA